MKTYLALLDFLWPIAFGSACGILWTKMRQAQKRTAAVARQIVERVKVEARAGAPASMIAYYVDIEARHLIAQHQNENAQSCDMCIVAKAAEPKGQ